MALLKPKRRQRTLVSHCTICCPYNGHQVSWCMGLCEPYEGRGFCGRLAPHAMKGRTQVAIENFFAKHGVVSRKSMQPV